MWFKVDDTLSGHRKARSVSLAAMGLWVMAGSFAGQQLTDGHIPGWFVRGFPSGARLARELVDAGLWRAVDDGWAFHDWSDYQPSRAEVEEDRESRRRRTEEWRARKALRDASRNGSRDRPGDTSRDGAPTRPDPTRELRVVARDGEVEVPYRDDAIGGHPS